MLDTLAIARTLTDAGMDREQAADHGDPVTRQDLDTLRADVRTEFAAVRGEIAQAVATLTWRLALVQAATIAAVGVLVRLLMP